MDQIYKLVFTNQELNSSLWKVVVFAQRCSDSHLHNTPVPSLEPGPTLVDMVTTGFGPVVTISTRVGPGSRLPCAEYGDSWWLFVLRAMESYRYQWPSPKTRHRAGAGCHFRCWWRLLGSELKTSIQQRTIWPVTLELGENDALHDQASGHNYA